MKTLLIVALALLPACTKKHNASHLQEEAVAAAKYYAPKLDAMEQRVQHIFKRGSTIPANLPGIDVVGKRLSDARDGIMQLRGIVGPGPDGKSAVEKQAEAAAKANKVADLHKLVHDTHSTLERGMTVITDNLDTVESWISQYDRQAKAMPEPSSAPTMPAPTPHQPNPTHAPGAM